MKTQYFSYTGTLYIDLADRSSTASEVISESIIVDLYEDGKPVEITIEHYSQTADSTAIETILSALTASVVA